MTRSSTCQGFDVIVLRSIFGVSYSTQRTRELSTIIITWGNGQVAHPFPRDRAMPMFLTRVGVDDITRRDFSPLAPPGLNKTSSRQNVERLPLGMGVPGSMRAWSEANNVHRHTRTAALARNP
jgi:hypothetical protein